MAERHRRKAAGPLLRFAGAALIGMACLAIAAMSASVHMGARHEATLAEYLLGVVGFVSGSAGSVLLMVGPHLFDTIELPARWRWSSDGPPRQDTARPLSQPIAIEQPACAQSTA